MGSWPRFPRLRDPKINLEGKLPISTEGLTFLTAGMSVPLRARTLNKKTDTEGGINEYIDGDTYEETMAIVL